MGSDEEVTGPDRRFLMTGVGVGVEFGNVLKVSVRDIVLDVSFPTDQSYGCQVYTSVWDGTVGTPYLVGEEKPPFGSGCWTDSVRPDVLLSGYF